MNNTVIDDTLSYDGVLFDDLGVASQCLSRTDAPTPHLIADDVAFTIAHHASPTHALVGLTDEPDNHFDVGNDKSSTNDSEDKCEGDLLSETQSSDSSLQTRHISHEGSDTEEDIQPNECMVLVFNSDAPSSTIEKDWSGNILRLWQLRCNITQSAMQSFLKIAPSLGIKDLPNDWRTVIRHSEDFLASKCKLDLWNTTHVCGNCFLMSFDESDIKSATSCPNCNVSRITCALCLYRCVLASSIGNKSKKSLQNCRVCGAHADISVTVRAYLFDVRDHLKRLFSSADDCLALLSPFRDSERTFYDLFECGSNAEMKFSENWIDEWPKACGESPYFKELWHGKRFYRHNIFQRHGMRSVLYELGIDWFPPHKEKQNYSVGVVSACPANLPMDMRSDLKYMFVLGVIEGPREPKHLLKLLKPIFDNFLSLESDGLSLYDALTRSIINVHSSIALCVCDSPAASKLGAFAHHSSYMPCIRCCYKGQICGHLDPIDGDSTVTTWDNEAVRNPTRSVREPPVKIRGLTNRVLANVEHIAFVDSELIAENQLRHHSHVRDDQFEMATLLYSPGHTKAAAKRLAQLLRVSGVSPLTLIPSFSLVEDFAIDALHTLLKGIALKMIELTFNQKFKNFPFNIKSRKHFPAAFRDRLRAMKFPKREDTPKRLHKTSGGLKASQIWVFCKTQCLLGLHGLIPNAVFALWEKLCVLVSGLLHTHVCKHWIMSDDITGLAYLIRSFYSDYLEVYGPCHMPYNFHLMLHVRLDCLNWSSLRSHSAFKFERLNHELMVAPRTNAESKVTQSIVRAVRELQIRLEKDTEPRVLRSLKWPADLPTAADVPCLQPFLDVNLTFSARSYDKFSHIWEIGDHITAIDYSTGLSTYITGSPIARITVFLHHAGHVFAMIYPIQLLEDRSNRIKGSFVVGDNTINYSDVNKFKLVQISNPPCNIHVSRVCKYASSEQEKVLLIPMCGPLPY